MAGEAAGGTGWEWWATGGVLASLRAGGCAAGAASFARRLVRSPFGLPVVTAAASGRGVAGVVKGASGAVVSVTELVPRRRRRRFLSLEVASAMGRRVARRGGGVGRRGDGVGHSVAVAANEYTLAKVSRRSTF